MLKQLIPQKGLQDSYGKAACLKVSTNIYACLYLDSNAWSQLWACQKSVRALHCEATVIGSIISIHMNQ